MNTTPKPYCALALFLLVSLGSRSHAQDRADALTVHLMDAEGRAVAGAEVEVARDMTDGEVEIMAGKTGPDGRAMFENALAGCARIGATAFWGGVERRSEKRDCGRVREIFLRLPAAGEPEKSPDLFDKDGNRLPPPAPALVGVPYLYDTKYSARFGSPGIFGLMARAGPTFCASWLTSKSDGCARPGVGAAADASFFVHLVDWWKLSFALGASGGYRFSPNPLSEAYDVEHHLLLLGPRLLLQGDAADWVFGIEAAPVGAMWRFTKVLGSDSESPEPMDKGEAMGAFFETSVYLGWRAWGHIPVGLYLELFGPLSSVNEERFPTGSITLGVFVARRFGRGRSIWDIEED